MFHNGLMTGDNLNNGSDWLISLKHYQKCVTGKGLFIRLSPCYQKTTSQCDGITIQYTTDAENTNKVGFQTIEFLPEYTHDFWV